jgi:hypothetical protein
LHFKVNENHAESPPTPQGTDLKLLEVVDGLSDGPVYLLYLGEGGAGADATARRRQRPLVIIIILLKHVTQFCNSRGSHSGVDVF